MIKRSVTNTIWLVTHGYSGQRQEFDSEAEAIAFWWKEAKVPSYIRPERMQPADLFKVTTTTELVNPQHGDFTGLDAALDELRKPVDEVRE